jgi:hypothetical protein
VKALDLRPRCARLRCNKLPRGNAQLANYKRYAPYCSYHCQESARVEDALRYLAASSNKGEAS